MGSIIFGLYNRVNSVEIIHHTLHLPLKSKIDILSKFIEHQRRSKIHITSNDIFPLQRNTLLLVMIRGVGCMYGVSESMSINYLPVTSLSSDPGTVIVLVDLNEATLTVGCPLV